MMPDDDRFAGMGEALEGEDRDVDVEADAEAATSESSSQRQRSASPFQATLRERLEDVDAGDLSRNATAYDGELAALLAALEDHSERRQEVANALADALGRDRDDVDDPKKSTVLSMAARVGLQEAAPELLEDLLDVRAERARQL